jgi:hypothetical protein
MQTIFESLGPIPDGWDIKRFSSVIDKQGLSDRILCVIKDRWRSTFGNERCDSSILMRYMTSTNNFHYFSILPSAPLHINGDEDMGGIIIVYWGTWANDIENTDTSEKYIREFTKILYDSARFIMYSPLRPLHQFADLILNRLNELGLRDVPIHPSSKFGLVKSVSV